MFATGLLLSGTWSLLSKASGTMKSAGAAAILFAGHEFYDPHQIVLPLVGAFSVGIVALVLGLRYTGGTRHPGRTVAAVAAVGISAAVFTGDLPTTYYLLPALLIVGLLAAIVDARVAVAAVVVPVLVAVTQLETIVRVGSDRFTWQLAAAAGIGILATYTHLRQRDTPGQERPL